MKPDRDQFRLDLSCGACSWVEECDPAAIERHLRAAGLLKREPNPSADLLRELVIGVAQRLVCPQCRHIGVAVCPSSESKTDWPEHPRCQICGASIDPERLEVFPGTTTCVACQRKHDQGTSTSEPEYCPRCGTPLVLRQSRAGLTRYAMVCPACGGRSK